MKKIPTAKRKIRQKRVRVVVPVPDCATLKAMSPPVRHNMADPNYLRLLRCTSDEARAALASGAGRNYLYPQKDDPHFNKKIAQKKEFYDTRYEEKSRSDFENIRRVADSLCQQRDFELEPHQMFVRNFMSFQTPYNSLLLFHGLGTGKTCSAISVCEEMRTYLNQLGITKRIIVVASPAVQENFLLQLFDERKLEEVDGLWNIKSCTGNKFIQEINPMNMKGLSRGRVIRQIKKIIALSYQFRGYIEFSNYIGRVMARGVRKEDSAEERRRKGIRSIRREFSNSMLVIDEVHNMRVGPDGKTKRTSENLLGLVSHADGLKLLLLSATPMFNSYKEVIWLLNLMNLNDKRYPITVKEVFDGKGNLKVDGAGNEVGKELLVRKAIGYVSYVRGENPFTFPYRIWPSIARNPDSLVSLASGKTWRYPAQQIDGEAIVDPIELLDLVLVPVGSYQNEGYQAIISAIKRSALEGVKRGLSYTVLDPPLQALNMVFPHERVDAKGSRKSLYGARGLARTMLFDPKTKSGFRYKDSTLAKYGRIFSPEELGKYSSKIQYICKAVTRARGIAIVYSQFIDGGAVPIALALEELGFRKHGGRSLFREPPVALGADAPTYAMITGDRNLTPDVKEIMRAVTNTGNTNGEKVKVVIVSRAGSEGLDFRNIRQMHILDPWYNLNRQEQIIGRAVRNLSHCALPYAERNVEIFLYGTRLPGDDVEAADLYVYRLAERKARKIGRVSRILKENAVDCLLNRRALDFSEKIVNKTVEQKLASGGVIRYKIGDRENSAICDYGKCNYGCAGPALEPALLGKDTYNETFIVMNLDKILQRIRSLFKERYIYHKQELVGAIAAVKNYPVDQINTALTYLIDDRNEYLVDMLGRTGRLVNVGSYYMFQPIELSDEHVGRLERVQPLAVKRTALSFQLPDKLPMPVAHGTTTGRRTTADLLRFLGDELNKLRNPAFIDADRKEDWSAAAAWAIRSLVIYDGWDKAGLVRHAMFHIIDILRFAEKKALLDASGDSDLHRTIAEFFAPSMVEVNGKKLVVVSDFQREGRSDPYRFLALVDGKWVGGETAQVIRLGDAGTALMKKMRQGSVESVNDRIGFMAPFRRDYIVYKTKNLVRSAAGRTSKGQRCDRGEGKRVLTSRINDALGGSGGKHKYHMDKSTVVAIYDKSKGTIVQEAGTGGKRRKVRISSLQLCAEGELIYRIYDMRKRGGKRWFFSSVQASINSVAKMGR